LVARERGGGAELRVKDRGPGVPAEHRERIFEKFHRVDDTLTSEKSGAGLGLSIARQLARGLGGELRYAARPGGGAEFVLELP
jgi:two-component system phosphate regulon sensor histidine kinase PhoR